MKFRFDNILEDWTVLYKTLSHDKAKDSKNKRFFRIKTIDTTNEFGRNSNTLQSPCMLYSVMVDAENDGRAKVVSYRYEIYFASRAISRGLAKNAKQNDELGTDQQLAMDDMVQDLLAYLHEMKLTGACPITKQMLDNVQLQGLKGLQLDKAEWASIPIKFGEWHIMGLSIEGIAPRLLCVNTELYNIDQGNS